VLGHSSYLEIRFTFGKEDDDRDITVIPVGQRWTARNRALTTALSLWLAPPFDAMTGPVAPDDDGAD